MRKVSLNHEWLFAKGTITMMELFTGSGEKIKKVDLPHDAMIHQERSRNTKNAHQTGFYPGGEYTYIKQWDVPEDFRNHTVVLEFEGVADTCRIYLNGELLTVNYNPYTDICIDVSSHLKFGEKNEIKVEVCSVEQSSRWYSGAGLYRPVNVWSGELIHIPVHGTRITTVEADQETAVVEIAASICNKSCTAKKLKIRTVLVDSNGKDVTSECVPLTVSAESTQQHCSRLTVDHPSLWSDETPDLYNCRIEILDIA